MEIVADATIIGRRVELEAIDAALDGVAARAGSLFLEGEPGIGKTRLWNEGVRLARDRGYRVLTTRPAAAEAQLAFAALADLAEPIVDAAELPDPQRRALDAALLRADTARPVDLRSVAAGFASVLRAAASDAPVVLAVDDVQWLDAPTAEALAFAFRRLEHDRVAFLGTVRVGPEEEDPEELRRAIGHDRLTRVRLEPLSVAALYELVRIRLGAQLSRPTLLRLHETSGGNPFFALELARALVDTGAEPTPDEPLPVPRELSKLLRERLDRLPRRANEALLYAAALSQPTVRVVEAAVPRAAAALREAADAAVVDLDGDAIRFTHPLLASTRYAAATARERRHAHAALARVVTEPEECAIHLALAAEGPDERVAAALASAAVRAEARGALAAAADLVAKAVDLTPAAARRRQHERRLHAARLALAAGRRAAAEAHVEAALAAARPGAERAEALCELGDLRRDTRDIRLAMAAYREAADEAAGDVALRAAVVERIASVAGYWGGGYGAALEHAREAVDLADRAGRPALLARALATLGEIELWAGRPAEPTLRRAERAEAEARARPPLRECAAYAHAVMSMYHGDFAGARERLERLVEAGRATGESGLASVLLTLGILEFETGAWPRARELRAEAHALAEQSGWDVVDAGTVFALADLDAATGDVDGARGRALAGLELTERTGRLSRGPRGVLARIELSLERYQEAYDYVAPGLHRNRERGVSDPSRFTSYAVEALARLGRVDDAVALLAPYEADAVRLGRTPVVVAARRCRGLIAAEEGRLADAVLHLDAAVRAAEALGAPLELGTTLLTLGEMQRRLQRKSAARETLTRAAAIFDGLGARVWADRTRREIARIGGRAAPAEGLSETQERIAALVRAGRTNREVASELHLSPHTVEWNLSRIYRKLGVRSRTELAANAPE